QVLVHRELQVPAMQAEVQGAHALVQRAFAPCGRHVERLALGGYEARLYPVVDVRREALQPSEPGDVVRRQRALLRIAELLVLDGPVMVQCLAPRGLIGLLEGRHGPQHQQPPEQGHQIAWLGRTAWLMRATSVSLKRPCGALSTTNSRP